MNWSESVVRHFTALGDEIGRGGPTGEIIELLSHSRTEPDAFAAVIHRHGVGRELWFRKQQLDLVLGFVRKMLEAGRLDAATQKDIAKLKEFLNIKEGEFLVHRPLEVASILQVQLEVNLEDGQLDEAEDVYQAELQRAFDLGYDDYLLLTRPVFERTISTLMMQYAAVEGSGSEQEARLAEQLIALEPLFKLATAHSRTIGTLY